jgi:hypothetical protein
VLCHYKIKNISVGFTPSTPIPVPRGEDDESIVTAPTLQTAWPFEFPGDITQLDILPHHYFKWILLLQFRYLVLIKH